MHGLFNRFRKIDSKAAKSKTQEMSRETLLARKKVVTALLNAILSSTTDYRRLLHCSESDAQKVLDAFQMLLDTQSFRNREQMIAAVCRFSKKKNIYPTQLFLTNPPERLKGEPEAGGRFGDVYKMPFEGKDTCFKAVRIYNKFDVEHFAKAFAKEATFWAQLSHLNILPFYGLARIGSRLAFVSPWAANGNLKEYLNKNQGTNRSLLCKDTAAGMEYLHQNKIVHGDLKGLNVVIDESGRAALCDFGLSGVSDPEILKWVTQSSMASKGGTTGWRAPELFLGQHPVHNTTKSDVFAWACVCYEILTGRVPYFEIGGDNFAVAENIRKGKKPTRPEDGDAAWREHGLTQWMWSLMEECWAFQADERPNASAVVARLQENAGPDTRGPGEWTAGLAMRLRREKGVKAVGDLAFWEELESLLVRAILNEEEYKLLLAGQVTAFLSAIFATIGDYRRLIHCSKPDAQKILDAFQTLLDAQSFPDRTQMIVAMYKVSKDKDLYPTQLFLRNTPEKLGDEPETEGKFGDVYKIPFEGKDACFKVIRKYKDSNAALIAKAFAKEAIPWVQLSHENVLPFYGLARIGSRLAFVSPWAANGNLVEYLKDNSDVNRILLCADTAAGMEYLHQNNIVHGDLKGLNVLIDSSGRAVLGGFGLSGVADPEMRKQSTMASKGGTVRWQAPEHFMEQDIYKFVCNTKESDVFAWAGVCYEIFTGRVPHYEISNLVRVVQSILQGKKPACPEDSDAAWHQHGLTQQMWDLMEECWAFQPEKRPNARAVVARLKEHTGPDTRGPGEWTDGLAMRLRREEGMKDVGNVKFWEDLDSLLARLVPGLETENTT